MLLVGQTINRNIKCVYATSDQYDSCSVAIQNIYGDNLYTGSDPAQTTVLSDVFLAVQSIIYAAMMAVTATIAMVYSVSVPLSYDKTWRFYRETAG